MTFKDRHDAGKKLAEKLVQYKGDNNAVVLGLPRGGVVVAYEVAQALGVPLDVVVPRKVGAPDNPEFAIGAVSEEGERVLDEATIALYGISKDYLDKVVERERAEAARRLKLFRADRTPLNLAGKTAIIVDDGVATGATTRAAVKSTRAKHAQKVVVATPVIAADTLARLKGEADEIVYLDASAFFAAVGQFYEVFPQTEDEEVIALLKKHAAVPVPPTA